jgi:hypothetical protein
LLAQNLLKAVDASDTAVFNGQTIESASHFVSAKFCDVDINRLTVVEVNVYVHMIAPAGFTHRRDSGVKPSGRRYANIKVPTEEYGKLSWGPGDRNT